MLAKVWRHEMLKEMSEGVQLSEYQQMIKFLKGLLELSSFLLSFKTVMGWMTFSRSQNTEKTILVCPKPLSRCF